MRRALAALSLASIACGAEPPDTRTANLDALTRAERDFARMAMADGQRAAWLHWFAPEGLMYRPGGMVNARTFMGQDDSISRPAPARTFDWRPAYGDVARSGDLGYSTGPVRIIIRGRSDGYYFSVWRKQEDGAWRVVLDIGTRVTFPDRDPFDDPYVPARPVAPAASGGSGADLEGLDRDSVTGAASFLAYLDPDARGLRMGEPPIVGLLAFRQVLRKQPGEVAHYPEGSGVSQAGDLGFSYGSYTIGPPTNGRGTYGRAWRRDATGAWRIVYDVARSDVAP